MLFISTQTQIYPLPHPNRGVTTCFSIWPRSKLNRQWRRANTGADKAYFLIEADPAKGVTPPEIGDFDPPTLHWLLAEASLVVVWSGDVPYDRDEFTRKLQAHKSIVIVLVRAEHHDAWVDLCIQHCRPDTEITQVRPRPFGMSREQAEGVHFMLHTVRRTQ